MRVLEHHLKIPPDAASVDLLKIVQIPPLEQDRPGIGVFQAEEIRPSVLFPIRSGRWVLDSRPRQG